MSDKVDFSTYSTSEQVVGKWVDGRTIYRKTITGNLSASATSVSYDIGRSNVVLIKADGAVSSENGSNRMFPNIVANGSAIDTHFSLYSPTLAVTGRGSFSYGTWYQNNAYTYRITFYYVLAS